MSPGRTHSEFSVKVFSNLFWLDEARGGLLVSCDEGARALIDELITWLIWPAATVSAGGRLERRAPVRRMARSKLWRRGVHQLWRSSGRPLSVQAAAHWQNEQVPTWLKPSSGPFKSSIQTESKNKSQKFLKIKKKPPYTGRKEIQ